MLYFLGCDDLKATVRAAFCKRRNPVLHIDSSDRYELAPNTSMKFPSANVLDDHGSHHVPQIAQISSEQFKDEAVTWHEMRKHMLIISDAIFDALAKQLPDRSQKGS